MLPPEISGSLLKLVAGRVGQRVAGGRAKAGHQGLVQEANNMEEMSVAKQRSEAVEEGR